MLYKVIGLMSGSSLNGLDIAYVQLQETGGKWEYEIVHTNCIAYDAQWIEKLSTATTLNALQYQLLHTEYGHYVGSLVNDFIDQYQLQHKVHLIASHGHTTFHLPAQKTTAQLGCGAAIAATTGLSVVSDLRSMDIALGGQGAPLVPIGESFLLPNYSMFLNLGGIANISFNKNAIIGFDICPANRVLNLLANQAGKPFDDRGSMAATGKLHEPLLQDLNQQAFYQMPFPKSLDNGFGVNTIYPLIASYNLSTEDALHTYVVHICQQIQLAVQNNNVASTELLVTGGGALNNFLMQQLQLILSKNNVTVVQPTEALVLYKEALIMAFVGVLRWREENTVLATVTGAARSSIGGALWLGNA